MVDDLDAADGVVHALVAAQLALDDLDAEPVQVRAVAGREVVQHAHLVAALQQRADEVPADEPAAAGDEDAAHASALLRDHVVVEEDRAGPRRAQRRDAPVERRAARVQQPDEALRDRRQVDAPKEQVEVDAGHRRQTGRRAARRIDLDRAPGGVAQEEELEAAVRPSPVVLGRRVVHLHAVGGGEHPPARRRHAVELGHCLVGVAGVLEHLRAEHDLEGLVLDGQVLDGRVQVGHGVLDVDVDSDIGVGVRARSREGMASCRSRCRAPGSGRSPCLRAGPPACSQRARW